MPRSLQSRERLGRQRLRCGGLQSLHTGLALRPRGKRRCVVRSRILQGGVQGDGRRADLPDRNGPEDVGRQVHIAELGGRRGQHTDVQAVIRIVQRRTGGVVRHHVRHVAEQRAGVQAIGLAAVGIRVVSHGEEIDAAVAAQHGEIIAGTVLVGFLRADIGHADDVDTSADHGGKAAEARHRACRGVDTQEVVAVTGQQRTAVQVRQIGHGGVGRFALRTDLRSGVVRLIDAVERGNKVLCIIQLVACEQELALRASRDGKDRCGQGIVFVQGLDAALVLGVQLEEEGRVIRAGNGRTERGIGSRLLNIAAEARLIGGDIAGVVIDRDEQVVGVDAVEREFQRRLCAGLRLVDGLTREDLLAVAAEQEDGRDIAVILHRDAQGALAGGSAAVQHDVVGLRGGVVQHEAGRPEGALRQVLFAADDRLRLAIPVVFRDGAGDDLDGRSLGQERLVVRRGAAPAQVDLRAGRGPRGGGGGVICAGRRAVVDGLIDLAGLGIADRDLQIGRIADHGRNGRIDRIAALIGEGRAVRDGLVILGIEVAAEVVAGRGACHALHEEVRALGNIARCALGAHILEIYGLVIHARLGPAAVEAQHRDGELAAVAVAGIGIEEALDIGAVRIMPVQPRLVAVGQADGEADVHAAVCGDLVGHSVDVHDALVALDRRKIELRIGRGDGAVGIEAQDVCLQP